jgi:hypothetical protein
MDSSSNQQHPVDGLITYCRVCMCVCWRVICIVTYRTLVLDTCIKETITTLPVVYHMNVVNTNTNGKICMSESNQPHDVHMHDNHTSMPTMMISKVKRPNPLSRSVRYASSNSKSTPPLLMDMTTTYPPSTYFV